MRSRTGKKRKTNNSAFTLIELILVTLLILTIIGLSVPLFKRTFSDLSVKNTCFNICKLMNYAQETAILQNRNYKMVFNMKGGTYRLLELDICAKKPAYREMRSRFGRNFAVPQGVTLAGLKNEVVFYPDGHCDEFVVNVLFKGRGYSVAVKKSGNAAGVKEVDVEEQR
jgi:hypothetical protein